MTETQIKDRLVDYLQDAHAMETNVHRMLQSQIETTEDARLRGDLEHHREETEAQLQRLEDCLAGYGEQPSGVKDFTAGTSAFFKSIVDSLRPDQAGKNARDGYAAESLEIASYELLERWAIRAGDTETAEVVKANRAEEVAMRDRIAASWDRYIDLQFQQEDF
jgi:ferritin-like metal-binding protein YciE